MKGKQKAIFTVVFTATIIISFLIHYRGATVWDVHKWNQEPVNVDSVPNRVWDWNDIQFLRGL